MNYENMIGRLYTGLLTMVISGSVSAATEVAAHSYLVCVPTEDYGTYDASSIKTLKDNGWFWSDELGWVFPTLG